MADKKKRKTKTGEKPVAVIPDRQLLESTGRGYSINEAVNQLFEEEGDIFFFRSTFWF